MILAGALAGSCSYFYVFMCALTPYLFSKMTPAEGVELDAYILILLGSVVIHSAVLARGWRTLDPYLREIPPPRGAPALWADPKWLRSSGLAQDITNERSAGELR